MPRVILFQGDSRGRWEGDTLVVDTTNQNAKVFLDQRGRFFTEAVHVVERVTMIDEGTIHIYPGITVKEARKRAR